MNLLLKSVLALAASLCTLSGHAAMEPAPGSFFDLEGDITLTVPSNGTILSSGLRIAPGARVSFSDPTRAITWLSSSSMEISGSVLLPLQTLTLEASTIALPSGGSIRGGQLVLRANSITVNGTIDVSGGNLSLEEFGQYPGQDPCLELRAGGSLILSGTTLSQSFGQRECGSGVVMLPGSNGNLGGAGVITLQPLPLPSAVALLAAGLGLMGGLRFVGGRARR